MTIVVSIPVHEEPKVIVDQILNITKYIKNVYIVLHISESYFKNNKIEDINITNPEIEKRVFINPTHLKTQWGDIVQTHLSNFKYIYDKIDFDYFLMHSSNDMYIKEGIEDYIVNYKAGFNIHRVNNRNSFWWPATCAIDDKDLQNIMQNCGQTTLIATQLEGSFYQKDLMRKIVDIIDKSCNSNNKEPKILYTKEEFYFSTIASSLVSWQDVGKPVVFSEVHRFDRKLWNIFKHLRSVYHHFLHLFLPAKCYESLEHKINDKLFKSKFYKTNIKVIKKILKNDRKYIDKNRYLDDGISCFQLYSDSLLAVKRIERKYNDKVREYIRNL